MGRFISEDPIGFAAGDGNLNRYVGNSPTNFTDPNGLQLSQVLNLPISPVTSFTPIYNFGESHKQRIRDLRWAACNTFNGGLSREEARKIANDLKTKYAGWREQLPQCPATEAKVKRCSEFTDDGLNISKSILLQIYHEGASSSYRSTNPQDFYVNGKFVSKTGQQCTYDNTGNLITQGSGAGTPDFAAAGYDSIKHVSTDVKTWCALGWEEYNQTWVPDDRAVKKK